MRDKGSTVVVTLAAASLRVRGFYLTGIYKGGYKKRHLEAAPEWNHAVGLAEAITRLGLVRELRAVGLRLRDADQLCRLPA